MTQNIYKCQNCGGEIIFGISTGLQIIYARKGMSLQQAIREEIKKAEEHWKKSPPSVKIVYLESAPSVCPHCGWKPPENKYFKFVTDAR